MVGPRGIRAAKTVGPVAGKETGEVTTRRENMDAFAHAALELLESVLKRAPQ